MLAFAMVMRTYMMDKIRVHDDHKVNRCELKSIDVCSSKILLPRKLYVINAISSIKGDQLVSNLLGAISRGIVDGNKVLVWLTIIPILLKINKKSLNKGQTTGNKLLGKGLLQAPGNHRQVFAAILVGRMMVLSLPDFVG